MEAAALCAAGINMAPTNVRKQPNFVLIVADDMGFSDAGAYGGEIETPHLDSLARGGVRFSQCYSTARCWPSRACLLTGYYAQQVRMDPPSGRLPRWARVLPQFLSPAGYRCYHSGKWHLMGAPAPVGDGGFHRSYLLEDHNRHFDPKNHSLDDIPLPPVAPTEPYYSTTAIAERGIQFLKEHAEKHSESPFCLYLAFTAPHFPLHAPAEDVRRFRERYRKGWDVVRRERWRRMRRAGLVNCDLPELDPETVPSWNLPPDKLAERFGNGEVPRAVPWDRLSEEQKAFQAEKMAVHAAMVHRMDVEIGRVLQQLRDMGAWEETLILFVSDNGASAEIIERGDMHNRSLPPGARGTFLCLGPGWSSACNTPLRLHKSWVHEGGIASPLIAHWPRGIRARGEIRHDVCHFVDILPTLMDLAGAAAGGTWNGLDVPTPPGRSLAPIFSRSREAERELFFLHEGNRAIRSGDWKLVAVKGGPWELYNMREDRCEQRNLAAREPGRVNRLARQWEDLERQFRAQAASA